MLDYNIDIFLTNVSKRFNIPKDELDKLKSYKNYYCEFNQNIRLDNTTCKIVKEIYRDRENNEYIILNNIDKNEYYGFKIIN